MNQYPKTIRRGQAPGGFIARTYSGTGEVLLEHKIITENPDVLGALVLEAAQVGVAEFERSGISIVACYDGDTGELVFAQAEVNE